jgi:hypothetical protein
MRLRWADSKAGEALFDDRGEVNEGRRGLQDGSASQGWVRPEKKSLRSIRPKYPPRAIDPRLVSFLWLHVR